VIFHGPGACAFKNAASSPAIRLVCRSFAPTTIGGIAAVVRESHSDRQSTLLVRTDGPIADPAWSVHEVDLEELILAYMGEQHEPRLQSLPRLEANG